MARQFFDGHSQGPMSQPAFSMPLHMAPPPEMAQSMRPAPDLSSVWNGIPHGQPVPDQMRRIDGPKTAGSSGWASEFDGVPRAAPVAGPAAHHAVAPQVPCVYLSIPTSSIRLRFLIDIWRFYIAYQGLYMGQGMYGGMPMGGMYAPHFTAPPNLLQSLDKGKGKSRDIDFDAAFAQIAASMTSSQAESARIEEVDDSVTELSETLQNANIKDGEQLSSGNAPEFKEYVVYSDGGYALR